MSGSEDSAVLAASPAPAPPADTPVQEDENRMQVDSDVPPQPSAEAQNGSKPTPIENEAPLPEPPMKSYSSSLHSCEWQPGDGHAALTRRIRVRTQVADSAPLARKSVPLDAFGGGNPLMVRPVVVPVQPRSRRRRGADTSDSDSGDDEVTRDKDRERDEMRKISYSRKLKGGKHIALNLTAMKESADKSLALVPIRIDIEHLGYRISDSFLWNLNEKAITPHQFAVLLCEDLEVPDSLVSHVADAIKSQLEGFRQLYALPAPEEGELVDITLDMHVGSLHLRDRFLWDARSELAPEGFARLLAADLGISGEFIPNIAHSIHEQIVSHRKRRVMAMMGTNLLDDGPPLVVVTTDNAIRPEPEADQWAPVLEILDDHERDRLLDEHERLARRRRRGGDLAADISLTGRVFRERRGRATANYSDAATESELNDLIGPDSDDESGATPEPGGRSRRSQLPFMPGFGVPRDAKPFVVGPRINVRDFENRASRVVGAYARVNQNISSEWKCEHCGITRADTPGVRRGPSGGKTLCNACGLYWSIRHILPAHRAGLADRIK